jgi:hypothetical protein
MEEIKNSLIKIISKELENNMVPNEATLDTIKTIIEIERLDR